MSDYIITNGELHSTDELMHWKYIKRERVNGKWRYYYDEGSIKNDIKDKLGYDERERMNAAKKQYDTTKKAFLDADAKKTEAYKNRDNYAGLRLQGKGTKGGYKIAQQQYDQAVKKQQKAFDTHYANYETYQKRLKEYQNTPLGKLDKFISKAKKLFNWK